MKTKKIAMGTLTAVVAIATPIATVISCGKKKKTKEEKIDFEQEKKKIDNQLSSIIKNENVKLTIPFVSSKTTKKEQIEEYKNIINDIWFSGLSKVIYDKMDKNEKAKINSSKEQGPDENDAPYQGLEGIREWFKEMVDLSTKQAEQALSIKEFIFKDSKGKVVETIKIEKKISEELKDVLFKDGMEYYAFQYSVWFPLQIKLWNEWKAKTSIKNPDYNDKKTQAKFYGSFDSFDEETKKKMAKLGKKVEYLEHGKMNIVKEMKKTLMKDFLK